MSTTAEYRYRIVNVFAQDRLDGNPLAVFEDGRGLDDATMQALALQFNLSETTFILPSTTAHARVRIFTPTFEMPFAGHPTLGTAHVVREIGGLGDSVTLEMQVGVVPVAARETNPLASMPDPDVWTLEAKPPKTRAVSATQEEIAAMLSLSVRDLGPPPLWVDTGAEQLVIPLASVDAVQRTAPLVDLLTQYGRTAHANGTRAMAYVWAWRDATSIDARFFFPKHGAVIEDPGTGSACANLGGWLIANGAERPVSVEISQGEAVGRPCRLGLRVDPEQRIFVSGRVVELGRGSVRL